MSTAEGLLREGRLKDAIGVLGTVLRDDPDNTRNRTFLFELLCFAGEYERAGKQLDVLASASKEAMMGALKYQAALNAELTRHQILQMKNRGEPVVEQSVITMRGTINGRPFDAISDADPRIGPQLELFAAGDYLRIPFRDISRLEMEAPKRLRDLLWPAVTIQAGPRLQKRELQDVFMPVLYPFSWSHPDEAVRLGRLTEWCDDETGEEAPYGQKMLLVSGEEFPILELRTIDIETSDEVA